MSKKIILTEDQIIECLRLYNENLLGSTSISEKLGIHKTIIIRTLKENGVVLGPSGRRNIGGKAVAQKKYESKPTSKSKRSKYYKNWSTDNRPALKEYHAKWRDDNREHVNQYGRDYERTRRANDPKYRLAARTRTAVYTCLKEANVSKYRSTFDLLGYSLEELTNHLESKFTTGMTWDNYGEWHVDHKRPIASFGFTSADDDEFKQCWCLDNLQPLWEVDNLSKGARYL
jgi:predicted ATP-dependent protease